MYFALRRRQAAMPVFRRRCWSLGYPGRESPAGITSWRTRRMARHKRNVSDLPYAAPPLSCVAFFVKELKKQVKEYDVIKQNIDSILKVERQPERAKETERG